MPKPVTGSYPEYFDRYISQVSENDAVTALQNQQQVIDTFFDAIPPSNIIDTERIFIFRALCFARHETQSLPGFDENSYAENSNANAREWQSLCEEMKAVRNSALLLFESFTNDMLQSTGNANNKPTTANAIGFIIAGHFAHHKKIITERYL
jgi:hypothetical protein